MVREETASLDGASASEDKRGELTLLRVGGLVVRIAIGGELSA